MAEIIAELRIMTDLVDSQTDDSTVDYAHFTDDYLQTKIDRFARVEYRDVKIVPLSWMENEEYVTKEYQLPIDDDIWLEESSSYLYLVDEQGTQISTDLYSVDWDTRIVTFSTDQDEADYYMRGGGFNLRKAALQIWKLKANLRASLINVRAGDHTLAEDQEYQHCLEMVKFYGGSSVKNIRLRRGGYNAQVV